MMQQQQWWHSDPVAPSQGQPQPIIAPVPSPQTPDQAAITHENAIRMHDQNQHIDPDTLRMMAERYVSDGTQPNFGMGNAVDRRNFWEAVAHQVAATGGSGGDLAVRIAQFRNGMHVIRGLEQQLENIAGNERTAIANGEVYAHSANQQPSGTQSNYPILNSISRAFGYNTGDPDIPATAESRNTFANEYARVVSSTPTGSGQLTDSAREQAMAAFGPNLSPDQRRATLDIMRLDMNNRLDALRSTIQEAYARLRQGQPISASPNGDLLDEHGQPIPVPGVRRNSATGGSATPPTLGHAPPGERMDATTVNTGSRGPDQVGLNTSGTERVPDPALAGLNAHVASMLGPGPNHASDAEIRQYIQDRGIPLAQVPGLDRELAWRAAHPGYTGRYDVDLDKHLVPVSTFRDLATNIADSAPGSAVVAAGNMVAGQQIPALVGATGGDAELARLGVQEIRNRHPVASVAGDLGGGAMTYAGLNLAGRAGLNLAERAAPDVFARLPAWVRGASAAGEAGEAAAPYSAEAASNAALRPTSAFTPRAVAADTSLGAYESPGNRTEGGIVGGLTGTAFRGAINTAGRAVSPTGGDLAPAYEEHVQPTVGQRLGGAANRIEQAFQSIPLLGQIQRSARSAAQDRWQLGGFDRALRNLPGDVQLPALAEDGTAMAPGTAPHAFTQRAFDTAYDRVHQRINVVDDPQLQQDLADIRQSATTLSDPSLSHFNRIMDNSVLRRLDNGSTPVLGNGDLDAIDRFGVVDDATLNTLRNARIGGGTLSGDELQQTLSEVRRTARSIRSNPTGDRELAAHLDDVSQAIYDNAARHSPPEAIETLNGINRGYGMLVRIENAANRAGQGDPGEYTPRALLNAERQQGGLRGRQFLAGNGLLSGYARAGMQLGQTVSDSGTAERILTNTGGAGLLGGLGAAAHSGGTLGVLPAAAWATDTFLNLPGLRSVADWIARPNATAIRPYTDDIRAAILARSNAASRAGVPGVVAAYGERPDGP